VTTYRDFIIGRPLPGQDVPILDLTGPPETLTLRPSKPVDPPGVDVPLPFEDDE
jgi:hypothetical protein